MLQLLFSIVLALSGGIGVIDGGDGSENLKHRHGPLTQPCVQMPSIPV